MSPACPPLVPVQLVLQVYDPSRGQRSRNEAGLKVRGRKDGTPGTSLKALLQKLGRHSRLILSGGVLKVFWKFQHATPRAVADTGTLQLTPDNPA